MYRSNNFYENVLIGVTFNSFQNYDIRRDSEDIGEHHCVPKPSVIIHLFIQFYNYQLTLHLYHSIPLILLISQSHMCYQTTTKSGKGLHKSQLDASHLYTYTSTPLAILTLIFANGHARFSDARKVGNPRTRALGAILYTYTRHRAHARRHAIMPGTPTYVAG